MEPRTASVAEPYARALLEVLEERAEREQCEEEIGALARAVRAAPPLRFFLRSPLVEREAKERALLRALPGAGDITRRFLAVLVRRGRADLLPEVAAAYERLRDERRGVVVAEVTTAVPLGREAEERCAEALRRATKREVRLRPAHDPALIGGMRTRIGSQVFDGSVRGRLETLRRRLVGE